MEPTMFGVTLKHSYLNVVECIVLLEPRGRKLILAIQRSFIERFSSFAFIPIQ